MQSTIDVYAQENLDSGCRRGFAQPQRAHAIEFQDPKWPKIACFQLCVSKKNDVEGCVIIELPFGEQSPLASSGDVRQVFHRLAAPL